MDNEDLLELYREAREQVEARRKFLGLHGPTYLVTMEIARPGWLGNWFGQHILMFDLEQGVYDD